MMHLAEPIADFSIGLIEIKITDFAIQSSALEEHGSLFRLDNTAIAFKPEVPD